MEPDLLEAYRQRGARQVSSLDLARYRVGDYVREGTCLARIIDTGSGEVISEIDAPENGTVFFIQSNPLAFSDSQLILLVR